MGILRSRRNPQNTISPAAQKLARLSTPDVMIACEQFIMAAGQELSHVMSDLDPGFHLERLETQLEQAMAAVEVLRHRP